MEEESYKKESGKKQLSLRLEGLILLPLLIPGASTSAFYCGVDYLASQ